MWKCWQPSWKQFRENLFSSSVAFLNMSLASQKPPSLQCWFQSRQQVNISWSQARRVCGMPLCCMLFFAKKTMTKTDRCAGALPWKRNQLLVLHFSMRFILTASLRRRMLSMYISILIVAVLASYTSDFREIFEASKYMRKARSNG